MAAFELHSHENNVAAAANERGAAARPEYDHRRLREECIIAYKVYDSCRQQDCLTYQQLGPARAAECGHIGDEHYKEGDVIDPPDNAASVSIEHLRIKKILIVDKEPSAFRNGYWDIDIKFVFEYRLIFREADGSVIGVIRANSIFNKKVSLFGSVGSDLVIATDLYKHFHDTTTMDSEPFVLVEAKASTVKRLHEVSHSEWISEKKRGKADVTALPLFCMKLIHLSFWR